MNCWMMRFEDSFVLSAAALAFALSPCERILRLCSTYLAINERSETVQVAAWDDEGELQSTKDIDQRSTNSTRWVSPIPPLSSIWAMLMTSRTRATGDQLPSMITSSRRESLSLPGSLFSFALNSELLQSIESLRASRCAFSIKYFERTRSGYMTNDAFWSFSRTAELK